MIRFEDISRVAHELTMGNPESHGQLKAFDRILKSYQRLEQRLEAERAATDWHVTDALQLKQELKAVKKDRYEATTKLIQERETARRAEADALQACQRFMAERDVARKALQKLAEEYGVVYDTDAAPY